MAVLPSLKYMDYYNIHSFIIYENFVHRKYFEDLGVQEQLSKIFKTVLLEASENCEKTETLTLLL